MVGKKTTLILQRITDALDSMNAMDPTWEDKLKIKGLLTNAPFVGGEKMLYDKDTVVITHLFLCKKPIGLTITEKDRFRFNGTHYDIKRIPEPGTYGHHLEILLLERT